MKNPRQVWQKCQPCVPKEEEHQRSFAVKIPIDLSKKAPPMRHSSNLSLSTRSSSKVLAIVNTMKTRMKAAVNNMLWKGINNRNIPFPQFVSLSLSPPPASHTNVTPFPSNQYHFSNLKNHALLKQYLAFVQEETNDQLEVDPSSHTPDLRNQENHVSHPLASSGAALIEYMVHHSSPKQTDCPMQTPSTPPSISQLDSHQNPQEDSSHLPVHNTCPATLEASILTTTSSSASASITTSASYTLLPESSKPIALTTADKSIIRCICDTPQEEFGAMVQCDDCTYWLHLECLEMDESLLGETFRCPNCYVTLGPGQHITTSAVSWRFAAHLRANRLAARYKSRSHHTHHKMVHKKRKYNMSKQHADDDSDTDHDDYRQQQKTKRRRFRPDRSLISTHDRLVGYDSFEQQNRSYIIPKMIIDPSITTIMTNSSGNVLFHSSKPYSDTEAMDSDTTESDSELGDLRNKQVSTTSSMSSISSAPPLTCSRGGSDTDTPSEANTLEDGQEFPKHETTENGLEQDDIDRSFWLAYLESSQQPTQEPCFGTYASDVFLGGDASFPHIDLLSSFTPIPDSPPSTLCSDQLNEFTFNAGPFWSSVQ